MLSEELVDIATRHQVYLERFKAGEIKKTDGLFVRLDDDLQRILFKLRQSDLSLLTAVEGAGLVEDIRRGQTEAYTEHLVKLVAILKDFCEFEREFELESINEVTVDEVEPDDNGFLTSLWAYIQARPMSATGKLLSAYLGAWMAHEVTRSSDLVRRAVAEGWTIDRVLSAFRGTKAASYSDGLFGSAKRNTATTINTSIQHASAATRAGVMENTVLRPKGTARQKRPSGGEASNAQDAVETDADGNVTKIPEKARAAARKAGIGVGTNIKLAGYRWISILDSVTSQLCRSLDQQVFKFGKGPLPPAHPNCRSSIIAEMPGKWHKRGPDGRFVKKDERRAQGPDGVQAVDGTLTYYDWLKDQPSAFQDDALGVTRAELFRKGGLSAAAFARLNLGKNFQPLTLEEMRRLAPRAFRRANL